MAYEYLIGLIFQTTTDNIKDSASYDATHEDESEILLVAICIMDLDSKKLVYLDQEYVKPNENPAKCDVDWDVYKNAQSLEDTLTDLESKFTDYVGTLDTACLITSGPETLKQVLYTEAARKKITLNKLYSSFFDLQKEYCKANNKPYTQETCTLPKMLKNLGIDNGDHSQLNNIEDVKMMSKVIFSLLDKDHKFRDPEIISSSFKEFPFPTVKQMKNECVVKIRGLPYEATQTDIAKFFAGLNICSGGILIILNRKGLKTGDALVLFEDEENCQLAFRRNRHHISSRYIEVLEWNADLFRDIADVYFPERAETTYEGVARLRGLPFKASEEEIAQFISKEAKPLDGGKSVFIIENESSLPSGDAFILFKSQDEVTQALKLHKTNLSNRYVEVFRSNNGELMQVACRQGVSTKFGQLIGVTASRTSSRPYFNRGFTQKESSNTNTGASLDTQGDNCVRMRGLPYETTVDEILEFFGRYKDEILPRGIHFVYNQRGQPTGECYVQMINIRKAEDAADSLHKKYMGRRYVEVYVCSNNQLQERSRFSGGASGGFRDRTNNRDEGANYEYGRRDKLDYDRDSYQYSRRGGENRTSSRGEYKIKLRGLPYKASKHDIADFLYDYDVDERDIEFQDDGYRPTGEAYVYFRNRDKARRAVRDKHRQYLGDRYVEIFEAY